MILLGLSKGGFAGLGVLGMPLMALAIPPVQAAADHAADPDRPGHGQRLGLPPGTGPPQPGDPAAGGGGRDRPGLPARRTGAGRGGGAGAGPGRHRGGVRAAALRLRPPDRGADAREPARSAGGVVLGAAAGFTSMVAHAGGPPFQVYVMPQRLPREVFVGTGVVFFALVNLIKVPPYLALGQFTAKKHFATSAVLFPPAIAATRAGVRLVRRVSGERFHDIVHALLLLLGGKLVFDGGRWLLG